MNKGRECYGITWDLKARISSFLSLLLHLGENFCLLFRALFARPGNLVNSVGLFIIIISVYVCTCSYMCICVHSYKRIGVIGLS